MTKYDTIPQLLDNEEAAECQTSTTTTKQLDGSNGPSKLIIGGVLMVLVFLAVRYSTGDVATTAGSATLMLPHLKGTSSSTMACSFEDCYASNCNQKVAPYTCLIHNGGPHGGCSATPWVAGSCKTPSLLFLLFIMIIDV